MKRSLQASISAHAQPNTLSMALRLSQIADLEGYPVDIWKCAAEVILAHTKVASSYVAVVSTPAEPDFQWPEAEEGEGEEEAAPETDDEAEDAPPPVAEKPEEGEEPAAEVRGSVASTAQLRAQQCVVRPSRAE